jgi:hypothetical protein
LKRPLFTGTGMPNMGTFPHLRSSHGRGLHLHHGLNDVHHCLIDAIANVDIVSAVKVARLLRKVTEPE